MQKSVLVCQNLRSPYPKDRKEQREARGGGCLVVTGRAMGRPPRPWAWCVLSSAVLAASPASRPLSIEQKLLLIAWPASCAWQLCDRAGDQEKVVKTPWPAKLLQLMTALSGLSFFAKLTKDAAVQLPWLPCASLLSLAHMTFAVAGATAGRLHSVVVLASAWHDCYAWVQRHAGRGRAYIGTHGWRTPALVCHLRSNLHCGPGGLVQNLGARQPRSHPGCFGATDVPGVRASPGGGQCLSRACAFSSQCCSTVVLSIPRRTITLPVSFLLCVLLCQS